MINGRQARRIECKGRDGNEPVVYGEEIGSLGRFIPVAVTAYPVICPAPGINPFYHVISIYPFSEPCHLKTSNLLKRKVGHIDVENRKTLGNPCPTDRRGKLRTHPGSIPEEKTLPGHNGEGHGRYAEKGAFLGGGHRSRVIHVLTHVGSAVDAGDDEVGPVGKEFLHPQIDTVHRRAVGCKNALLNLPGPEGLVEGNGMADACPLPFGGHHVHGMIRGEDLYEGQKPRGMDPVIIGEKNEHRNTVGTGSPPDLYLLFERLWVL